MVPQKRFDRVGGSRIRGSKFLDIGSSAGYFARLPGNGLNKLFEN